MSTLGKILGAAGIATGVLGAAALGGVTAQRVSVRRYQSAQAALLTDPNQEDGYGLAEGRPDLLRRRRRRRRAARRGGRPGHGADHRHLLARLDPAVRIVALPAACPGRPGLRRPAVGSREGPGCAGIDHRATGLLRPALARQVHPRAGRPLDDGPPGRGPAEHDRDRGPGWPRRADRAFHGRDGDPEIGRPRPWPVRGTDRRDRPDLHGRHLPEGLRAQPAADHRRKSAGPGHHRSRGQISRGVRTRPGQQPGRGVAAHPKPRLRPQGRAGRDGRLPGRDDLRDPGGRHRRVRARPVQPR